MEALGEVLQPFVLEYAIRELFSLALLLPLSYLLQRKCIGHRYWRICSPTSFVLWDCRSQTFLRSNKPVRCPFAESHIISLSLFVVGVWYHSQTDSTVLGFSEKTYTMYKGSLVSFIGL